jgi:uncharacterized protein
MKISVHALSVELFSHALGNLSWILEKAGNNAAQRKIEPAVLLGARLAPDMLPLTRQVQIACDIAKNAIARLAAQEPLRFEDNESSFEELRTRIARTIDVLKSVPASALEGADERPIKVPGRDRTLEFKNGVEFLQHFAIPNVFFHATTAYDILRHNGVDLGKRDFLAAGRDQ